MNPDDITCVVDIDAERVFFRSAFVFEPHLNKPVVRIVLEKRLAEVVKQLNQPSPQTDRVLTDLAKEKSLLETAIASFSDYEHPEPSSTSRKDRAISRKMRRRAAKID